MLETVAMAERIRVLIVDDHPLFRTGLAQVIKGDSRFELVGETGDGEEALGLAGKQNPDVVVLDINLPGLSGLDVASKLHARREEVRVVVLTMYKDESMFNRAMNVGVLGYVLKENAVTDILNCLSSVARGEAYLSPQISGYLLRRRNREEALRKQEPGVDLLTPAELRILRQIALNKTSKEIAAELFISPRTVEAHRANICGKLKLRGANRLLQFAIEHRDEL